jgi:hypothetical protein
MRKSGLRHLILIRIPGRAKRSLRLRRPTITRRRGITCDYRVSLFLGWPRIESVHVNLDNATLGYGIHDIISMDVKK